MHSHPQQAKTELAGTPGSRQPAGCRRYKGQTVGDEYISLARVLKTQGRHGEVAVEVHSDVPDRFVEGMGLFALDESGERLMVVSCLDNLGKGAAGQAVQNMNGMLGFRETVGLQ